MGDEDTEKQAEKGFIQRAVAAFSDAAAKIPLNKDVPVNDSIVTVMNPIFIAIVFLIIFALVVLTAAFPTLLQGNCLVGFLLVDVVVISVSIFVYIFRNWWTK